MKNPFTLALKHADGSTRRVIVEPILLSNLEESGVYKIYKTSVDNESALFTEELEINEGKPALADEANPDYLGSMEIESIRLLFKYQGDLLSPEEQKQIADFVFDRFN